MVIHFFKYHGAGNDFLIFDNRNRKLRFRQDELQKLCHRRKGIGADGVILLQQTAEADFEMIYYNADGRLGTMCGNGARCIADFAFRILEITGPTTRFLASDGPHRATVRQDGNVELSMTDVREIDFGENTAVLNTGSPHYVRWVSGLADFPVVDEGRAIRNSVPFRREGINVNFVEKTESHLRIPTYERGVEDETLACGTGIVAAAIASTEQKTGIFEIEMQTHAGDTFQVCFKKREAGSATDILLVGPAQFVFQGQINRNNL